jgi:hypothetical protein
MAGGDWVVPASDGSNLAAQGWYQGGELRGSPPDRDLRGIHLWSVTLRGVDFRGANLEGADFLDVVVESADFRQADLSKSTGLSSVRLLDRAKFDDRTKLDGINLDELTSVNPVVGTRLKRIRYAGSLRRTAPLLYWPWWWLCDCGRSWPRLLAWGLALVLVFAVIYSFGQRWHDSSWLPHLVLDCPSCGDITFSRCFQFSALTTAGLNMPHVVWHDTQTGFWVAAETWLGLAFLGIFVTIAAVQVAARQ